MSKAKLLGEIFTLLEQEEFLNKKTFARRLWALMKEHKVKPENMECNKSLLHLDLAEIDVSSENDTDVIYDEF